MNNETSTNDQNNLITTEDVEKVLTALSAEGIVKSHIREDGETVYTLTDYGNKVTDAEIEASENLAREREESTKAAVKKYTAAVHKCRRAFNDYLAGIAIRRNAEDFNKASDIIQKYSGDFNAVEELLNQGYYSELFTELAIKLGYESTAGELNKTFGEDFPIASTIVFD